MNRLPFLLIPVILLSMTASDTSSPRPRILVFSRTAGFRHSSIPDGKKALLEMGKKEGFLADTTEDAGFFTREKLKEYKAVVFLNTSGNVLDSAQQVSFEEYIHSGGGFAGVHAATDTEHDWPWFNRLAGARFSDHPKPQEALLRKTDEIHPATSGLPPVWTRFDEWYNFKDMVSGIRPLLLLDEKSYVGGKHGDYHPVAWYRPFEGGRSFYTALGHTAESYREPLFLTHLLGGIRYAAGLP